MSGTDKRPSREQSAPVAGALPLPAVMVERLRSALGRSDGAFLYRNEALDVLAFTLTGLPAGPERDVVFERAVAALKDVARPTLDTAIAALRGAA